MNTMTNVLLLSFAYLVLFAFPDRLPAQEKSVPQPLDLAKPASWSQAVGRTNDQLVEKAKLLIGVVKDKKRPDDERREAIYTFARIGNRESLEFLVANLTLTVEVRKITGDEDLLKRTPCSYALRELAKDNWNVVPVIFASLDGTPSDLQLGHSASVLKRILGHKAAEALIDASLSADVKPNRKSNLLKLKRSLD